MIETKKNTKKQSVKKKNIKKQTAKKKNIAPNKIDVSFVMTVYNKEYYLPSVLKALLNQSGVKNPEFIFIDDCSKDNSVKIIEEMTQKVKNVILVAKKHNDGISASINQGIAMAKGEWVRMLDSDDIFPLDSTEIMLKLAKKHKADMVYGTFSKTGKVPTDLEQEQVRGTINYKYSPDALHAVLTGRFTRMGQLIRRTLLQKAQGADPRVFIQDETIPLRCALLAKHGVIKMQNDVVLVPIETNSLSKVKIQLDHDRFLANYYILADNRHQIPASEVALLNIKAVSANWKLIRKTHKLPYLTPDFCQYLYAKIFKPQPNMQLLDKYKQRFLSLDGILRPKNK